MSCAGGIVRWAAVNETLAGLTVRPGSEGLLPPPPLQAASSSTRAAHSPCSIREARLIKLPPFALSADHIRRQVFFFFLRLPRRFPKNSFITEEAGQRIRSCRDAMTSSKDAMT